MSIERKIFYGILGVFTLIFSLTTITYYLYFEENLLKSQGQNVEQINRYVFEDVNNLLISHEKLAETLQNDGDISSLYDDVVWLATLGKKIVRKNFKSTFQIYPFLKEVKFYKKGEEIFTVSSSSSYKDSQLFSKTFLLKGVNGEMVFRIDIISFIQTHLIKNSINKNSLIYIDANWGSWLISSDKIKSYYLSEDKKMHFSIGNENYLSTSTIYTGFFNLKALLNQKDIQDALQEVIMRAIVTYILVALAIFFIAKYLSTFITKPLSKLESASKRIIAGDYSQVSIENKDETTSAFTAFNLMSKEIESFTGSLQQEVAKRTKELEDINANLDSRVKKEVEENREKDRLLISQSKLATMGEAISMIAHQWRQPLSILNGHMNSLEINFRYKESFEKEEILQEVDKTRGIINHLSETINIFQNYLKPKRDGVEKEFVVKELLEQGLSFYSAVFKSYEIEVELQCKESIKAFGYSQDLIQVLLILFSNAKDILSKNSTEKPKLLVSVQEQEKYVSIDVLDNGGGIKISPIEKVFEPYITDKGANGTGLGLFIAKNLLQKFTYAEIGVINKKEGALFTIKLSKT